MVSPAASSAVRAFARATRGGAVPARLELLGGGDPDYRARCEALAAAAGVGDRVRFRGHLEEPLAAVARAQVALMCSPAEAFGRVTAEAMSCGLPVIGFSAITFENGVIPNGGGLIQSQYGGSFNHKQTRSVQ